MPRSMLRMPSPFNRRCGEVGGWRKIWIAHRWLGKGHDSVPLSASTKPVASAQSLVGNLGRLLFTPFTFGLTVGSTGDSDVEFGVQVLNQFLVSISDETGHAGDFGHFRWVRFRTTPRRCR